MKKCDDCEEEVMGTRVYWKGKDRCWKCDEKFNKKQNNINKK